MVTHTIKKTSAKIAPLFNWIKGVVVFKNWLRKKKDKGGGASEQIYRICEGRSGMWHYHLCLITDKHSLIAICGAETMHANAPLETWGHKSDHIPDSYCEVCDQLAQNNQEMKAGN